MADGSSCRRARRAGDRRSRLHRLELRPPHPRRGIPAAHVVVLDALTYAGRRENLDGLPAALADVRARRHPRSGGGGARRWRAATRCSTSPPSRTSTARSRQPGEFIQTDVFGVFVLCEEARRAGVRRFIQVSTDEVYGEVLEGHSTEEWPLMPRSPYAASKAGGDRLAYAYWATYGLPVVVTRCSNNYGPRQYPEKLVPLFVTNAIDDQPLPVYGDRAQPSRLAARRRPLRRARAAAHSSPGIEGETFNIGAQHELDVLTITDTMLHAARQAAHADPPRRGPSRARPALRGGLQPSSRGSPAGSPRWRSPTASARPSTGIAQIETGGARSRRASSAPTTSACTGSERCSRRCGREDRAARLT